MISHLANYLSQPVLKIYNTGISACVQTKNIQFLYRACTWLSSLRDRESLIVTLDIYL